MSATTTRRQVGWTTHILTLCFTARVACSKSEQGLPRELSITMRGRHTLLLLPNSITMNVPN